MAKLYLVPTPIGNLEDITLRAINILRSVDLILAEDTRTTSFLLRHLEIEKPLRSHHKFNEHATAQFFSEMIEGGRDVALVSDAGTPGISDPGNGLLGTDQTGIDGDGAVLLQPIPAEIPGIDGMAFQNNDFHRENLLTLEIKLCFC